MRGQLVSYRDFSGGVNVESAPYSLADNEGRDLRNVVPTVRGAIRKRDGAQTLVTAGAVLTSLFAALSPTFLIAAGGTVLYSITAGGVLTTIKTGMTSAARWSFVQAPISGGQGPVYGVNGTDAQQWDGVAVSTSAWTAATGTFPAGAKWLLYHGNRVWAAGMAAYAGVPDPGSALVFSNLEDPRDWPVANVVQFAPGDGEAISGIGRVGQFLVVFKPSKMWIVFDLDTGANRPIGENVGCVAHRSIVETPTGTFFLGKDAVYRVNQSTVQPVTAGRLTPLIVGIPAGKRDLAAGGWWNNHYYLSIPSLAGATANDLTLDFDTVHDSWWLHTLAESEWATWEQGGQSVLYGARPDASKIIDRAFVAGVLQDGAANFTAYWKSPFYVFGDYYHGSVIKDTVRRKRVRMVHFDGKGRVAVSVSKDFSRQSAQLADVDFSAGADGLYGTNDGTVFGADDGTVFGEVLDIDDARILNPGVARAWSVIVANSLAQSFEIESVNFAISGRKN